MTDELWIKTDRFKHRQVKAHFVNPCSFGEDFAQYLGERLRALDDVTTSGPFVEDYGCALCLTCSGIRLWIALSYVGDGPQEDPPEWRVAISDSNFLVRLFFRKRVEQAFGRARDFLWATLKSDPAITILVD